MKRFVLFYIIFSLIIFISCNKSTESTNSNNNNDIEGEMIINHNNIDINDLTTDDILTAKENLHIAYGHTSHGSQLTTGMDNLDEFMGGTGLYDYNNGGSGGALDLHDSAMSGDCGYYPQWVNNTRNYLGDTDPDTGRGTVHTDVNVIIWSWCGQVSNMDESTMISNYLEPMTELENDYPGIIFVYMTGHLDGTGENGNLHIRNEQIRQYCRDNNKVLYDFADIESYDPDGNYYLDKLADDGCNYDSDNNGSSDANWAVDWQNSHTEGVDWYSCSSSHSEPLNANLKAFAAWHLWVKLGKSIIKN